MNSSDFAAAVAFKFGGDKAAAKNAIDAVTSTIVETVSKGDDVTIHGFGKFSSKDRPAREGRNPSTGETIQIKASKNCAFSPAKQLKDTLNG